MEVMKQPGAAKHAFEGPCYLKMMVNNAFAGAIIGKNGSAITGIEQQTRCALKLSPSSVFYPKTRDRVLIMSGQQEHINDALCMILEKIRDTLISQNENSTKGVNSKGEGNDNFAPVDTTSQAVSKVCCRLPVPKSAVSGIIGKGGQQIRELQETTGATVKVSNREEGISERMIVINGTFEQVRAAALSVASSIQSDPYLKDYMHVLYKPSASTGAVDSVGQLHSFAGSGRGGMSSIGGVGLPGPVPGAGYGNAVYAGCVQPFMYGPRATSTRAALTAATADVLQLPCDISMQVPDALVGAIIGRSGACVSKIIHATGARIQISQKGDTIPGTTDRKILISGTVAAVHNAHLMLMQRIHSIKETFSTSGARRSVTNNTKFVKNEGVAAEAALEAASQNHVVGTEVNCPQPLATTELNANTGTGVLASPHPAGILRHEADGLQYLQSQAAYAH